jgi:hypothetical protein
MGAFVLIVPGMHGASPLVFQLQLHGIRENLSPTLMPTFCRPFADCQWRPGFRRNYLFRAAGQRTRQGIGSFSPM